MGEWAMLGGGRMEGAGAGFASSQGLDLDAHGSNANEKGSWEELIAATSWEAQAISLMAVDVGNNTDFLLDIGVGAGGSETVLIPNLLITGGSAFGATNEMLTFPVGIPKGSRVAARCQAAAAAQDMDLAAYLHSHDWTASAPLSRVTAYGANTADSGGVEVDPGGSANTKGAYSEIEDATAAPCRLLYIALGNQGNTARAAFSALLDIAVGAGGSEVVIIPDLQLGTQNNTNTIRPQWLGPFPVNIPAGVRLAARAASSTTDATDRLFDVAVYGVD
jgi:hypothetical protein